MLELFKEKGFETSLPRSMPYLVSLTEWTVLDFIGFEDLFSGHKSRSQSHQQNLSPGDDHSIAPNRSLRDTLEYCACRYER